MVPPGDPFGDVSLLSAEMRVMVGQQTTGRQPQLARNRGLVHAQDGWNETGMLSCAKWVRLVDDQWMDET
jgi:hypothetical protein